MDIVQTFVEFTLTKLLHKQHNDIVKPYIAIQIAKSIEVTHYKFSYVQHSCWIIALVIFDRPCLPLTRPSLALAQSTFQYSTVQYITLQYSTVQYSVDSPPSRVTTSHHKTQTREGRER